MSHCGLDWLLCSDTITPQMLISEMSGRIPKNYRLLSEEQQLWQRKKLGMSGQVGWFYDEFGQQFDAMHAQNGPMSDFKGLLRRLDDCHVQSSQATRAHAAPSRSATPTWRYWAS
ncbi:MAG TPA: hypothetical protein VHZ51_19920 [Ktedonobacteraceae bacterium]|nr:hypothetical protein [Ktedonobacteraceae bacterium]